jgi:lipopolysaccharide export system protein LptA
MNELQTRVAQFYNKLGGPPIKIGVELSVTSPSDILCQHASGPDSARALAKRSFPLLSLADGTSKTVPLTKFFFRQSLQLRGLCAILLVLFLCSNTGFAQKKVKLKNATTAYGSVKNGERFDRLVGNFIFEQNTTTIYCDSAHFFRSKNMLDAFGHVHITEGDSVDITALGLSYDGNTKVAKLRKNVVFVKLGIARLYTDFLDYYRIKNEARYFNGGKLIDTTNTLTSWKGYYDIPVNIASFKTNVVGVNPDYTLTSDTLQYNSKTRVIYFRDTTLVKTFAFRKR